MKKKFLFLEKTQKFTKTPSSIPCGGLYYTVDPLNISYIVFYPFLFSTSSVALFYSPTVLRVSKVYPNISKRLCNFDHPTTNAGGLSAWSPRLLDRMSLAAAQALTVDQSAAGKPLGAPSLCVCVAPTLSLCHQGAELDMESTEFTLEDCTRLWEIDTSGCCSREREEEICVSQFVCMYAYHCVRVYEPVCVFTYMPPEDPVQQAASGRLWWLTPVQIWRSRPLRPKHIQISETLSFYHLNVRRGEGRFGELGQWALPAV